MLSELNHRLRQLQITDVEANERVCAYALGKVHKREATLNSGIIDMKFTSCDCWADSVVNMMNKISPPVAATAHPCRLKVPLTSL